MSNPYAIAPCTVALLSAGFFCLTPVAQSAESDIALSFDPAPVAEVPSEGLSFEPAPLPEATTEPVEPDPNSPLAIPSQATEAPLGKGGDLAELPPPPEPVAPVVAIAPEPPSAPPVAAPTVEAPGPLPSETVVAEAPQPDTGADGITFAIPELQALPAIVQNLAQAIQPKAATPSPEEAHLPTALAPLFAGGADSLVAIAVGSAEGTRTPTGEPTPAYKGHKDPGNGVWNLGSFSYQHGASSPQEADARQLARLQKQAMTMFQDAEQRGMALSLEEQLNAIDLANQSPAAALSRGGYLDRLQEARQMGLKGTEAISWARTRAYLDPDTRQWNAPGLGNTVESITADQERRMGMISRAMESWSAKPFQANANSEEDLADRLMAFDIP